MIQTGGFKAKVPASQGFHLGWSFVFRWMEAVFMKAKLWTKVSTSAKILNFALRQNLNVAWVDSTTQWLGAGEANTIPE